MSGDRLFHETEYFYMRNKNVLHLGKFFNVRFEIFMAVTMKNGVFWDVTPCGSCKNRRFRGT
jgi:hypothetical protein